MNPFADLFPPAGTPGAAFLEMLLRPTRNAGVDPRMQQNQAAMGRDTGTIFGPPPPVPDQSPIPNQGGRDTGVYNGPPVPGSGAAPGGPPVTNPAQAAPSPGGSGPIAGQPVFAGNAKYPTANPRFALQSAIQDMGGNPFRADPMMSMLMNAAPGLATSFLMQNVGITPGGMAAAGGEGEMFRNFLRGSLGSSGGVTSALSSAQSGMPGFLQQMTALQDQMKAGGQTLNLIAPFAQYLQDAMADPQGAAGMFGSLTTPFMSQRVGQSYLGGLQDAAGQGLRRRADDYARDGTPRNFWDYLF